MKNRLFGFSLFFFCLVSLSFVVATPQIVMDSSFNFGETVLGVVELGDGVELLSDDLSFSFLEGRKKISMTHDVVRHESDFYFYIYPSKASGYTLNIEGILYREGNSTKTIDLSKNFSVVAGGANVLSVRPGLIYTLDEEEITITNKGNTTLDVSTPGESFSLTPSSSRVVVVNPSYDFSLYEVSSYKSFKIPVIFYGGTENPNVTVGPDNTTDNESIILKRELSVNPGNLSIFFDSFDSIKRKITVKNIGGLGIEGLYVNSDFNFSLENLSLTKNQELEVEIEFNFNDTNGSLFVGFGATEIEVPVNISFDDSLIQTDKTCSELGGIFCLSSNLTCSSGAYNLSSDSIDNGELCCLTSCVPVSRTHKTNWGMILGILIFLCLAVGGYVLYKRYNGVKSEDHIKTAGVKKEVQGGQKVSELVKKFEAPNRAVSQEHMDRHNRRVGLK